MGRKFGTESLVPPLPVCRRWPGCCRARLLRGHRAWKEKYPFFRLFSVWLLFRIGNDVESMIMMFDRVFLSTVNGLVLHWTVVIIFYNDISLVYTFEPSQRSDFKLLTTIPHNESHPIIKIEQI